MCYSQKHEQGCVCQNLWRNAEEKNEPTLSTIYALAQAFDVRVVDLLAALPKDLTYTD